MYYELGRRQRVKNGCAIIAIVILIVIALIVLVKAKWLALMPVIVAMVLARGIWRAKRQKLVTLEPKQFNTLLQNWTKAHRQPKGLIVRTLPRGTPAPQRQLEADIAD